MKNLNINQSTINRFFTGVLCMMLALPVMAQEDELKDLPGFIDFGDLTSAYGEPKISNY